MDHTKNEDEMLLNCSRGPFEKSEKSRARPNVYGGVPPVQVMLVGRHSVIWVLVTETLMSLTTAQDGGIARRTSALAAVTLDHLGE